MMNLPLIEVTLLIPCLSVDNFNRRLEPEFRPHQVEAEVVGFGIEVLSSYHSYLKLLIKIYLFI